jgi:hypothetical protein
LGAADSLVQARIIAASAGMAEPLSVTSAPCQTLVEAEPETSSTEPHYDEELPALPQYPPLGRYGNRIERVEAVSLFAGSCGRWDAIETRNFEYGDEQVPETNSIMDATAQSAEPDDDLAVIDIDARDEGDIYRQLVSWLYTHRQDTALRELTQLRRVLALIPDDKLGQSWQAYLMCPASANATAVCAPGVQGRSWFLRAKGTLVFTEFTGHWQHWRMRQHLCADGAWQLDQSSEGPRAPAWCGDSAPQLLPSGGNGIPLQLTEPQRLRRLLGTQWTLLMLLAPEPLPLALRR